MLCLTCYHLSPTGARYCGACGRSLGGRFCRNGHFSPRWASRCVTCGDAALSPATPCLPLGWLYRGLAGLIVLLCLHWLFFHGVRLGQSARSARRTGVDGGRLSAALQALVPLFVFGALILSVLPEHVTRPLRRLAGGILRGAGFALTRIVPWLWRQAVRLIGPGGRP